MNPNRTPLQKFVRFLEFASFRPELHTYHVACLWIIHRHQLRSHKISSSKTNTSPNNSTINTTPPGSSTSIIITMNALRTTAARTSKMLTRRFASKAYTPKTIDFTVSWIVIYWCILPFCNNLPNICPSRPFLCRTWRDRFGTSRRTGYLTQVHTQSWSSSAALLLSWREQVCMH